MYITETKIRVRYGETDQMGFVYYGNYALYNEVARVEALRKLGISYKLMEERGVIMPVLEMNISYKKSAFYDDVILIKTFIKDLPLFKMDFNYEMYNEKMELLNISATKHCFLNRDNHKIIKAPDWLTNELKKIIEE